MVWFARTCQGLINRSLVHRCQLICIQRLHERGVLACPYLSSPRPFSDYAWHFLAHLLPVDHTSGVLMTFGCSLDRHAISPPLPFTLSRLVAYNLRATHGNAQVVWPLGLERLDLGDNFNQPVHAVKWPRDLEHLTFGQVSLAPGATLLVPDTTTYRMVETYVALRHALVATRSEAQQQVDKACGCPVDRIWAVPVYCCILLGRCDQNRCESGVYKSVMTIVDRYPPQSERACDIS